MKYSLFYLILCIFLVNCSKEQTSPDTANNYTLTLGNAMHWYEANQRKIDLLKPVTSARERSTDLPKFRVIWDESSISIDKSVMQIPILFEEGIMYGIRDKTAENKSITNAQSYLLLMQDEFQKIEGRVMQFYPSGTNRGEVNNVKQSMNNFTGIIIFSDLKGKFIGGAKYKDGRSLQNIVKRPNPLSDSVSTTRGYSTANFDAPWPPYGCDAIPHDIYERTCTSGQTILLLAVPGPMHTAIIRFPVTAVAGEEVVAQTTWLQ
ncbi:MAG: hypothetical protein EOO04_09750 [Chitinophagaceae bacterium]|nr:MAG: hypothetical protein EOO04_09750 [Chitinophagaceae bacterium]